MLKPWDFPIGTKRLPLDTNYYETFNRPNVTLVDLKRTPVEEITPAGHQDQRRSPRPGRHRLRHRVRRAHRAARGARHPRPGRRSAGGRVAGGTAHLPGRGRARVPQPVHHHRPGQPVGAVSNMPVSIEQHVEWIGDCLAWLREQGADRSRRPSRRRRTGPSTCSGWPAPPCTRRPATWYMGANIPGKPRVFLPYIGGVGTYRTCAAVAAAGTRASPVRTGRKRRRWHSTRRRPRCLSSWRPAAAAAARAHAGAGARRDGRDARRGGPGPRHGVGRATPGRGLRRVRAGPRPRARVAQPRGVIVYYHGGGWVIGGARRLRQARPAARAADRVHGACSWTTGSRRSTASRSRWTTRGPRCAGPTSAARNSGPPRCTADRRRRQRGRQPVRDHGAAGQGGRRPADRAAGARLPGDRLRPGHRPPTGTRPTSSCCPGSSMVWFWDHYAPDSEARLHPDASPLRSRELRRPAPGGHPHRRA